MGQSDPISILKNPLVHLARPSIGSTPGFHDRPSINQHLSVADLEQEATAGSYALRSKRRRRGRKNKEPLFRLAAAKEIRVAAAETAGFIRTGQCFHIKRRRRKKNPNTFKASGVKLITTAAAEWSFYSAAIGGGGGGGMPNRFF